MSQEMNLVGLKERSKRWWGVGGEGSKQITHRNVPFHKTFYFS